jgi:hypothetical protein
MAFGTNFENHDLDRNIVRSLVSDMNLTQEEVRETRMSNGLLYFGDHQRHPPIEISVFFTYK